jgi:hypothetical protein
MRNRSIALAVAVLAAACAHLPSAAESEKKLVDLEKQSWVAWKNRDAAFFENFLSPDHIEMSAGGVANKRLVVATVASPACVVRSYSVDSFKVTFLTPEVATVTYHATQDTICNNVRVPAPAWVSSTYVYRGNRWWNAVYQQTWRQTAPPG